MMDAAAGPEITMDFFFCPTYMKIGFKSYSTEQYITFLRICCSGIILKWRIWRIVVSTLEGSNRVFSRDLRKQFLQLMLKWRTVFPPHSVVHVPIQLKKEMKQYVIEPCNEHLPQIDIEHKDLKKIKTNRRRFCSMSFWGYILQRQIWHKYILNSWEQYLHLYRWSAAISTVHEMDTNTICGERKTAIATG